MRKQFILLAFLAAGGFAFSQNYFKTTNIQSKSLDEYGNLRFVSFQDNALISSSETEAVLKEALHFDANNKLVAVQTKTDKKGGVHVVYKHFYKGKEVLGNSFVVHSYNGKIKSINGTFNNVQIANENLKSDQQILSLGLAKLPSGYVDKAADLPSDLRAKLPTHLQNQVIAGELKVLPKTLTKTEDKYAYAFNLLNIQNGAFEKIYMDAVDGSILRKEEILKSLKEKKPSVNTVLTQEQSDYLNQYVWSPKPFYLLNPNETGNAETHYSGIQEIETRLEGGDYILEDDTRFVRTRNFQNGDYLLLALMLAFGTEIDDVEATLTVNFTDDDNNWTQAEHAASKNDGALDGHWAFSQSYDYFKQEFDRDGFDNQNSLVRSYIHVTFFGSPVNAAWLDLMQLGGEGGIMLVGDGDYNPTTNTGSYDILSTLDVMSHEYAHGINRAGGGLIYEKEHGALDESFADMWGATIEAKMAPDKDKWTIAEEAVLIEPKGFRSFRNPKLFNQPDTYKGTYYFETEGCTPSADNDNCGVHTNSGVPNYWYYLISDGGEGVNDHGYEYSVEGFGIEKAAQLIYAVQENYVQSLSTFEDVMNFTIEEAVVQYGEDSMEVNTVKAAWCAVGVAEPDSEICTTLLATQDLTRVDFRVYPNPVVDILNVKTAKNSQNMNYKITNVAGQTLQAGKLNNGQINVSVLPKGVYVLTVNTDEKPFTVKFVKK